MKTIAILNQKGGVGKTTTAVTLAHGLAMAGLVTLLVDLDAQGNVADALGLMKEGMLYALLVENDMTPVSSGRENLDVILSDKTTVAAKQVLAGRNFRELALRNALSLMEHQAWVDDGHGYDVCVLDAAPGADLLQVGAMMAADGFLVPVALDHLAVVGAADALATAASLMAMGDAAQFLGILPTMWERSTNESDEQMHLLVENYKQWVWEPVPKDTKAREAPAHGETLWEYAPALRRVMDWIVDSE